MNGFPHYHFSLNPIPTMNTDLKCRKEPRHPQSKHAERCQLHIPYHSARIYPAIISLLSVTNPQAWSTSSTWSLNLTIEQKDASQNENPVSSLHAVLNGKVILHCKHIKEWNPTHSGLLLCLCPSQEDLRLRLQLAQGALSQISKLASFYSMCYHYTRPALLRRHTQSHTDMWRDSDMSHAALTHTDGCTQSHCC